jgi:Spy/CpxP family protein refolding chaperone
MRKILLTISLVCLMGAPSAFAYYPEDGDELATQEVRGDQGDYEQRRDRRGHGMRGNPHKKMKKIRSKILRKRVGLDEATLARVEAIFESFDEERKELHQAKRKTMKALRDLVQSDSDEQEAYATLILAMKQAREGLRQLREEEAAQLADVLTPKQQVKLMMALHKMKRRMQGMRGKRGRRGGGEGRRGPRNRRGVDEEGGGYGPPPGRSGRGYGGERFEDDRIDL